MQVKALIYRGLTRTDGASPADLWKM